MPKIYHNVNRMMPQGFHTKHVGFYLWFFHHINVLCYCVHCHIEKHTHTVLDWIFFCRPHSHCIFLSVLQVKVLKALAWWPQNCELVMAPGVHLVLFLCVHSTFHFTDRHIFTISPCDCPPLPNPPAFDKDLSLLSQNIHCSIACQYLTY